MSTRRSRGLLALIAVLAVSVSGPATAQIPEEFTNLQVLPKDIESRQLVSIMRGFAGALGVRCNYCHVGGESLQGMDFATDENPHKNVARAMMKMVSGINEDVAAAVGEGEESPVQVKCVTCHRGQEYPRLTEDVLRQAYDEGGLDAVKTRYRELRDEYYGSHTYDFSAHLLPGLAQDWMRADKLDDAMALLQYDLEFNPDSSSTYGLIGQIHASKDEKDAAIAAWEKALELDPENDWVKRMLQRIQG